jgi:hypothetical protein
MSLILDNARVAEALKAGVRARSGESPRVTRGWPKTFEILPCLAVSEASNRVDAWRDDTEYLQEIETDVRVFAVSTDEIDELAPQAAAVMNALGYKRVLSYDNDGAEVKMKVMRYRVFM